MIRPDAPKKVQEAHDLLYSLVSDERLTEAEEEAIITAIEALREEFGG